MPELDPYLTRGRAVGAGRFDGDPAAHEALSAGRKAHERASRQEEPFDPSTSRAAQLVDEARRHMLLEKEEERERQRERAQDLLYPNQGGRPAPPHLHGQSLAILVFIPWAVFVVVATLDTLSRPATFWSGFAYFTMVLCAIAACTLIFAYLALDKSQLYYLLGVLCLLAVFMGCEAGHILYKRDMAEYWLATSRAERSNVPPSDAAASYRDAAALLFTEGARVDVNRILGYRPAGDGHTYCVAPILDETQVDHAEFWAAGMDCCEPLWGFFCGDVLIPQARAGAVLPSSASSHTAHRYLMFLDAAHQAASLYHMSMAAEPVFVHWLEDPTSDRSRELRDGIVGLLLFCVMYLVLSVVVASFLRFAVPAPKAAQPLWPPAQAQRQGFGSFSSLGSAA